MKSIINYIKESLDCDFGNCTLYIPKDKQQDVETELESVDIYFRKCEGEKYRVELTHSKKAFNTIVKEYGLKVEK